MAASDYPNGQIPLSELVHVGNNQYLEPTTAQYWSAMVVKAAQQGVALACLEGYRSLAEQQRLYNGYQQGLPGFYSAAYPGTSPHGYGKAVDVNNVGGFGSAKYNWLKYNAPQFGFTNTVGIQINEPWHWVFQLHANIIPASQIPANTTANEEDTPMYALIENNDQPGTVMLIRDDGDWVWVKTGEHLSILTRNKAAFRAPGLSTDKWAGWAQQIVKAYLTGPITVRNGRSELTTYPA